MSCRIGEKWPRLGAGFELIQGSIRCLICVTMNGGYRITWIAGAWTRDFGVLRDSRGAKRSAILGRVNKNSKRRIVLSKRKAFAKFPARQQGVMALIRGKQSSNWLSLGEKDFRNPDHAEETKRGVNKLEMQGKCRGREAGYFSRKRHWAERYGLSDHCHNKRRMALHH